MMLISGIQNAVRADKSLRLEETGAKENHAEMK